LCSESSGRQVAIADFIYNCGLAAYQKSTLKKRIDEKDWASACVEIKRWNKGGGKVLPGLVRRRAKEAWMLMQS
jgi:lysozyme